MEKEATQKILKNLWFFNDFEVGGGLKTSQRGDQEEPKRVPREPLDSRRLWGSAGSPTGAPRRLKRAHREPQEGPKRSPREAHRGFQQGPRDLQDTDRREPKRSPKRAPKGVRGVSRRGPVGARGPKHMIPIRESPKRVSREPKESSQKGFPRVPKPEESQESRPLGQMANTLRSRLHESPKGHPAPGLTGLQNRQGFIRSLGLPVSIGPCII